MTYEHEDLIRSEPDEYHLACVLLSPTATVYLGQVLTDVDPDDFHDPILIQIWGYARLLHAGGARVTKRALVNAAEVDTAPGAVKPTLVVAWLTRVAGQPVYPSRLPGSVRAVKDTARLRRLVQAADRMKHRALGAEDYAQALEWSWDCLRELEGGETPPEVVPFTTLVDDWHKQMAAGPLGGGQVVPTPWPDLDDILGGGLHPGRSYVIAARPGMGKTTMGLNVAACAAEQGYRSLVVSQEMTNFEVTGKLMAAGGGAEYSEIVRYQMSEETSYRVTEYGETNRHMPLYSIDTPGLSIEYITAVAKSMKRNGGLDLLFMDYLQLLEPTNRRVPREQQVSHISRAIKLAAKELSCACVTTAQLNRDNVKANRRPILPDLRESGSVEQDADVVILIHHE
ncbi:MAG: replicative DNA helicase, partial [Pseudonocardiaceae bacterium]